MLCSEILTSALKLLGEVGDAEDNPDYTERAPYIIAAFAGEAFEVDAKYRMAHGLEAIEPVDHVYVDLDEDFPLSDRLAPTCVFYLASILIADENPELSEKYYDRYCESISDISASLPYVSESIKDVYPNV